MTRGRQQFRPAPAAWPPSTLAVAAWPTSILALAASLPSTPLHPPPWEHGLRPRAGSPARRMNTMAGRDCWTGRGAPRAAPPHRSRSTGFVAGREYRSSWRPTQGDAAGMGRRSGSPDRDGGRCRRRGNPLQRWAATNQSGSTTGRRRRAATGGARAGCSRPAGRTGVHGGAHRRGSCAGSRQRWGLLRSWGPRQRLGRLAACSSWHAHGGRQRLLPPARGRSNPMPASCSSQREGNFVSVYLFF
jgi:hypothetical protein